MIHELLNNSTEIYTFAKRNQISKRNSKKTKRTYLKPKEKRRSEREESHGREVQRVKGSDSRRSEPEELGDLPEQGETEGRLRNDEQEGKGCLWCSI